MHSKPLGYRIAVFASGSGSNLESLISAEKEKFFSSKIALVVSNKKEAYALERAKNHNIKTYFEEGENELLLKLQEEKIDLIVLAGYLKILGKKLLDSYKGRIINIHPSLLPKFGGKGMYGIHVHEAVFAAKEKRSGASVHFVTEEIDGGEIILQASLNIEPLNSPKEIQEAVLILEHQALKTAIKLCEEVYN